MNSGPFDFVIVLFGLLMLHGVASALVKDRPIVGMWTRRIAAVTFLVSMIWTGRTQPPSQLDGWIWLVLGCVVLSWFVLTASRASILLLGFFHDLLFAPMVRPVHAALNTTHQNALARREALREMREAPERERVLALREQEIATAQRRRDDARASVYLLYSFYAPKVGDRFTRADADRYIESFMNDSQTAEAVERRGRELLAILERHLAEVDPFAHGANLESLITWRDDEFKRLESLPVDEALKREYGVLLRRRFDDIFKKSLKEIRP